MLKRSSKTKLNVNLLAKSIVDNSATEKMFDKAVEAGKNLAAVLLGRLGGLKGGKARALQSSAKEQSAISKKAVEVRRKK